MTWPEPPNYYEHAEGSPVVILQQPTYPVINPEPSFSQSVANMRPGHWTLFAGMTLLGAVAGYYKGSQVHWQKPAMYFGALFMGKSGLAWASLDSAPFDASRIVSPLPGIIVVIAFMAELQAWSCSVGRWLDRDTNGCLNLQRIGERMQRSLELCSYEGLEASPTVGTEYQQGYKLGLGGNATGVGFVVIKAQLRQRNHLCRNDGRGTATTERKAQGPGFNVSTDEDRVRLRSEAEAPWRSIRFTLFGFTAVSAGVAFIISLPQLVGALGGAPGALELTDVLTNLGINGAAVVGCGLLIKEDLKARDAQMRRLMREEQLSACGLQLANGRTLSLAQLRGSARVVICAGTAAQVGDALAAAEPFKAELVRRGVLVVPLPIYEANGEAGMDPPGREDLRWRATPTRLDAWRDWFAAQLVGSKAVPERGLYISLRKDGRVRGSGMGCPPWGQLAAQLPPEEGKSGEGQGGGIWTGLLDGMDGRV
ncbi:hypothetical protein QJQ45_022187 [Haematococcus lacustris]|nr:hypothetical protein QJQ45_022187 [Haematococcus lacustris]